MRKWKCVKTDNEVYMKVNDIITTDNNGNVFDWRDGSSSAFDVKIYERIGYKFEELKEAIEFTKSDLKPFMLVRFRTGELCLVSQSKRGITFNGHGFMEFSSYNDELLCFDDEQREEDYDIVEVYDISNMCYDANEFSTTNRDLLFKRIELSSRDIKIKELQDKMDEIKREMDELKNEDN